MRKFLLAFETGWTIPFFLLSWLACSVWFALRAGHMMAEAKHEDKAKTLDTIFGKLK